MSARAKDHLEWQYLDEACKPDLYMRNAFRVTALDVTDTLREAKKLARDREQLQKLGLVRPGAKKAMFPLPESSSNEDVTYAVDHKISNPYRRLIEELFWFWPTDFNQPATEDEGLLLLRAGEIDKAREMWLSNHRHNVDGSIALHNLAVLHHLQSLDSENKLKLSGLIKLSCPKCKWQWEVSREACEAAAKCPQCQLALRIRHRSEMLPEKLAQLSELWKDALGAWSDLWANDEFWSILASRANENDETITRDNVDIIRQRLPQAIISINSQLAIRYCNEGQLSHAERHARAIREAGFPEEHRHAALAATAQPVVEQAHSLSNLMEKKVSENEDSGLREAVDLLVTTRPLLKCFEILSAEETFNIGYSARDRVAETAMRAVIAYGNKTHDWEPTIVPTRHILEVVHSEVLKAQIVQNLATIEENVHGAIIDRQIKPVKELCDELMQEEASAAGVTQTKGLTPEQRYSRFSREVKPRLDAIMSQCGRNSEEYKVAANICARCLRNLSVELHNTSENYVLALEAIKLARGLCADEELQKTIEEGCRVCQQHCAEREQQNRHERYKKWKHYAAWAGVIIFITVMLIAMLTDASSKSGTSGSPPSRPSSSYGASSSYSSPQSSYRSALAAEIEVGKNRINTMKKRADEMDSTLDAYNKKMDAFSASGMTDEYNSLVPVYNALVDQRNQLVRDTKSLVEEVNTTVRRYNAGL